MASTSDPALSDHDAGRRYTRVAMLLHWLLAACFAFQLGLGWRMDAPRGPQSFAVFQLHKSLGITILALTLIRLVWRLTHPAPPLPATLKRHERVMAHAVHWAFYLMLIGMPVSGWMLVSSSPTGVPTILYGVLPWPNVPGVATLPAAAKAAINARADNAHHLLALLAYALIALHLAGALKHQFLDRDQELWRMMPVARRRLGVAALVAILLLAALALLGKTLHLSPIARAQAPVAAPSPAPAEAPPAPAPAPPAPPPATAAAPAAAPVEPSIWVVRKRASSLGFHTAWSQGAVDGHFGTWDAAIRFDPAALASSSVKVTIDMASAATGAPDTQNALPGTDWFDVAAHPTATFAATRFRHLGGDRYEALGRLTIRGVARPLTLPFTLAIAGDVATMTGTARIDRVAFGVGQGEWSATTDLPAGVTVTVKIAADRKP